MFETIQKNKIESLAIVSAFIIVITLILYYVFMALDFGYFAIIFALIFSIGSAWGSYYYSDNTCERILMR